MSRLQGTFEDIMNSMLDFSSAEAEGDPASELSGLAEELADQLGRDLDALNGNKDYPQNQQDAIDDVFDCLHKLAGDPEPYVNSTWKFMEKPLDAFAEAFGLNSSYRSILTPATLTYMGRRK